MFEITRRPHDVFSPVRDLMGLINDPFFSISVPVDEEGNLPLDIVEGDQELIIRASLPGFDKKDVEVHAENGVLSIKAKHVEEHESKGERFYRRERRMGSVSRRVALPGMINESKAQAELANGVLTVRIPRAEVAKPKQIAIK